MRRKWELHDGPTLVTVTVDTLRRPRSETGTLHSSLAAAEIIARIDRMISELREQEAA